MSTASHAAAVARQSAPASKSSGSSVATHTLSDGTVTNKATGAVISSPNSPSYIPTPAPVVAPNPVIGNFGGYQGTGQSGTFGAVQYNPADPTNPYGSYQPATANPATAPTTTPTNPTTPGDTTITDAQAQMKKIQQQNDEAYAKFVSDTNAVTKGSVPLTSGEQAQVEGLKQQYTQLITDQNTQNTASSGLAQIRGYQTGAGEYDPSFQNKVIGSIFTAGANKIADLNTKMAGAVASLTQAFKDDKIKQIKDAYDEYKTYEKEKGDALQQTIKDTQAAIKVQTDAKIAEAKVLYDTVTKPINDIALEAGKNHAPTSILSAISNSPDVINAINNAGEWLQTATGWLGDYLQYKKDTEAKGLVPLDSTSYKDQQDAKAAKAKINEAYAVKSAQNLADANSTASDKVQQKLEQQYRQVLAKEFSARTGALGVENAKVGTANHLNSLFMQYYDPKTGNYNIPTAQYAELAIGLANMISPTGGSSDADRAEIKSHTAAGDLKGALQYATGIPQNGNTQDIIKNLIDSVDRQAETAIRNREVALQNMRDQAPTDLEQSRIDALNKSTEMVSYEGQDRISKSNVDAYIKANPSEAENIAKLYEIPGATDQDIEDYLRTNGLIQ